MRHLKLYNEEAGWKSPGYLQDEENVAEISDVMIDLIDLGVEDLQINSNAHLDQTYEIQYRYGTCPDNGLNLSVRGGDINRLDGARKRLKEFNLVVEESYNLIQRLENMGYEVAYLSIQYESNRFKIHIRKKKIK